MLISTMRAHRPHKERGAGGLDAKRSRAWAGRHLHRTAFGAVQVCSLEARSPDRTAKLAFFIALGFVRFGGESRPSSRRYDVAS